MIHAENAESYIDAIIEGLPAYMEDERVLLALVRESVLNHVIFAYSNKPNYKHDYARWEELCVVLRRFRKDENR